MDRTERINAALTAIGAKLVERTTLREQLEAKQTELSEKIAALTDAEGRAARWRAIAEMPHWSELDGGASIAVGYECRYLLRTYRCTQQHTKTLLRAPTNGEYWQLVE